MKNLILAIAILGFLSSCKGDKPTRPVKVKQASNIETSPAVRDGNVIRQKVTVGANQNANMDIDVTTALNMLKEKPTIKVIDVRTPSEIAGGMFKNAQHIDFNAEDFKTQITKLDKKDTYIVYCAAGGRSKKAVNIMRAFGYKESFNMKDGYSAFPKAQ